MRLTIPRRVYTQAHMDVVAESVAEVFEQRDQVKGLRMTYEPAQLRFFQARFEPVAQTTDTMDGAATRKGITPRLEGLERPRQARVFGADGRRLQAEAGLASALGFRGALFVKRDDRAGPGMGGNKARKLQYVIADALDGCADCLITSGAAQSNHAALTAVCGGIEGLEVHLVLGGDPEEMRGGNLVIEQLVAAHSHFVAADDWELLVTESERIAAELRGRAGGRTSSPSALRRRSARSATRTRTSSCSRSSTRPASRPTGW